MPARWDIFCKVVDNYGDAGVCWRLARILAREHDIQPALWIDELGALARIAPSVDVRASYQRLDGVDVRRWTHPLPPAEPAEVVIEAFGCGLPDDYARAIASRARPPAWIVLEYLSAEPWVEGTHELPSPHPRLKVARRFWFPGFTEATGGLLRERGLLEARDAFRAESSADATLWRTLGMPVPAAGDTRVSLFCYPNEALPDLLDAWADGEYGVTCIVPEGVAAGALDCWTRGDVPHPGHPVRRGRIALHGVPFVDQDRYDRLLWSCDVNFVRGEDSFVRAQWAARPFVWHIYPQDGNAHRTKLEAFLDRHLAGTDPAVAGAERRLWRAWNGDSRAGPIADAWREFADARPPLARHCEAWAQHLASLPDLASKLVRAVAGLV
jgi:uncharacterized repeat protein (TIGR03837 family)